MAWINVIPEAQASAELTAAYDQVLAARGRVSNILSIHSVHPAAMLAHVHLYAQLMFGTSEVTRAEREMIAVAVSAVNGCHY